MHNKLHKTLSLVIVGHVDHGKSTIIGRLLHEVDALPEGKEATIREQCERRGMPFEWSFLTDALQAERDQGVTIETSHIWFSTATRRYVIIDAPGHREFLKNMVSGASQANAAILVVDAEEGVQEQTRRHAYLLHLLGIQQVIVAINKMDRVDYAQTRYDAVAKECSDYLKAIGVRAQAYVPISAQMGEGISAAPKAMKWYEGSILLSALEALGSHASEDSLPLRLPIQDVYKFDDRRILAGRIVSGVLKKGDELLFSPSGAKAKIASVESWPKGSANDHAGQGESVGITLDEPIFVERGEVASHLDAAPFYTTMFRGRIFWLGKKPLQLERRYTLKIGTQKISAELREIECVIDSDTLARARGDQVERHQVAEVIWRPRGMVALDAFSSHPTHGRFVILDEYTVAGGGITDLEGFVDLRVSQAERVSQNLTRVMHDVTTDQRVLVNGHLPGILWFTGLSGAGKTTLAQGVQQRLFSKGYQVMVLDGDNVRHGLCRDLGFSAEDRRENLRRSGEVAALFAQAGFIVITSFISPTHEDRSLARSAAQDYFHSVYIKADLETCEQRDVKGLYKRARAGEIKNFTGISAPYDAPDHADVVVDTTQRDVESCVDELVEYIERQFVEPVQNRG